MERSIDAIIREAMAQGKFDNLPGRGKPQKRKQYDGTPEELSLAYSMLEGSGFVPYEVELMNTAAALREKLATTTDPEERRRISLRIQDLQLQVSLFLEGLRSKP